MNVSSVSSSSYLDSTSTTTASTTTLIKKQIKALEQKIQAENASQDDAQTKQTKVAQYQSQLVVLQAQLTQATASKSSA